LAVPPMQAFWKPSALPPDAPSPIQSGVLVQALVQNRPLHDSPAPHAGPPVKHGSPVPRWLQTEQFSARHAASALACAWPLCWHPARQLARPPHPCSQWMKAWQSVPHAFCSGQHEDAWHWAQGVALGSTGHAPVPPSVGVPPPPPPTTGVTQAASVAQFPSSGGCASLGAQAPNAPAAEAAAIPPIHRHPGTIALFGRSNLRSDFHRSFAYFDALPATRRRAPVRVGSMGHPGRGRAKREPGPSMVESPCSFAS
jgi:hypothetical protein